MYMNNSSASYQRGGGGGYADTFFPEAVGNNNSVTWSTPRGGGGEGFVYHEQPLAQTAEGRGKTFWYELTGLLSTGVARIFQQG